MDAAHLNLVWHDVISYLSSPVNRPSHGLVLGTGLVAFGAVVSRRVWPLARTVVTIAHEGGHALVALLTGRRLAGVRVFRSTAGVTASRGRVSGPGIVATTAAGYLTPPLLGLGGAALLATGHLLSLLLLSLAGLAGLTFAIRNAYGLLAIGAAGAVIVVTLWRGSVTAQACLGYALTWFLLLGGVRPVLELQRARRHRRGGDTDADQLAGLTGLPGWLWTGVFGAAALVSLAVSARWLVT